MIRLDAPRPHDLIGADLAIAGVGTGFEATISYRIGDGHDELSGSLACGGGRRRARPVCRTRRYGTCCIHV
jgi:hypothetical protein